MTRAALSKAVVFLLCLAVGWLAYGLRERAMVARIPPAPPPLYVFADDERKAAVVAMEAYKPAADTDLQKLEPEALADLLRRLPGVGDVKVSGPAKADRIIVHVADYHLAPREGFEVDPNADDSADEQYAAFLRDVASIQAKQEAVLGALAAHHGLRRVYVEGFVVEQEKLIAKRLEALAEFDRRVPKTRRTIAAAMANPKLVDAARELEQDLDDFACRWLELGAACRLQAAGKLQAVPLEDEATDAAANPMMDGKRFAMDAEANAAREAAMVRRMIAGPDRAAVVVLGGGHELASFVSGQLDPRGGSHLRLVGQELIRAARANVRSFRGHYPTRVAPPAATVPTSVQSI